MIKVGINGFGTIGKRVASAIRKQDDLELVGVAKRKVDYAVKAYSNTLSFYGINEEFTKKMREEIEVSGTLQDLLKEVDVIIDATPEGVGIENKKIYDKSKVKSIFQGGETHELTGFSFNAISSYDEAKDKNSVRVVSCNTTGLIRTLYPLHKAFELEDVKAVLVRRGTDPLDHKKGPINAIVPDLKFPSHHGPDVSTVMQGFNIETMSVKVPTTLMHFHIIIAKLNRKTSKDEVLEVFSKSPRVLLVDKKYGIESTAQIMELAKELGRDRSDFYENVVWKDSINIKGKDLYYYQSIHQESVVVPENIDAIRALYGNMEKMKSIEKTNKTLGILGKF